ncbi:hypothetical protein F2Q69_00042965 [Brassica cretica]|uniref:Uncharacterized protein n=1 Tax=Brassica cretica TaxID=69181 RepID=A0A8S9NS83_BRACR|nr:hypothetical protein F2Q69_00042965 [Brassica cretica]
MATSIDTKQERVRYSLGRGALRTGREQRDRPSSADGLADRAFDPARPSTKLDWSSSADGLAGHLWSVIHVNGALTVNMLPPPYIYPRLWWCISVHNIDSYHTPAIWFLSVATLGWASDGAVIGVPMVDDGDLASHGRAPVTPGVAVGSVTGPGGTKGSWVGAVQGQNVLKKVSNAVSGDTLQKCALLTKTSKVKCRQTRYATGRKREGERKISGGGKSEPGYHSRHGGFEPKWGLGR